MKTKLFKTKHKHFKGEDVNLAVTPECECSFIKERYKFLLLLLKPAGSNKKHVCKLGHFRLSCLKTVIVWN